MAHVWLIGMMGTGKTTVGAIIAERMERPLYDTDAIVMEATGRTIPDLFADGAEVFRAAERIAVSSCAGQPDAVIATGGGAILDPTNVTVMSDTGSVVLLTATTDEIRSRLVDDDSRPLLAEPGSLERIVDERAATYQASADTVVDTTDSDPHQIAEEVLAWLST